MNHRDRSAHDALSQTAKLRMRDSLHDHINRERRKRSTTGARAPKTWTANDVVSERDQSAIEAGVWPVYTP